MSGGHRLDGYDSSLVGCHLHAGSAPAAPAGVAFVGHAAQADLAAAGTRVQPTLSVERGGVSQLCGQRDMGSGHSVDREAWGQLTLLVEGS